MRGCSTSNSVSRNRSGVGLISRPGSDFSLRDRNSPAITLIPAPAYSSDPRTMRIRPSTHLHQCVTALPMLADVGDSTLEIFGRRRLVDKIHGLAPRDLQDFLVAQDIRNSQARQA